MLSIVILNITPRHSNTKRDKNIIKLSISLGIVMVLSIAMPCMTLNVTKLSIATLSMTKT